MKTLLLIASLLAAASAQAGDCVVSVKRTPCPGKTEEAFKPYGGKEQTEETKSADSADACRKLAADQCAIKRKGVLLSKEVKAKFGSTPVGGGANLCDPKSPDFNQCG
jgi:hypothetical protein